MKVGSRLVILTTVLALPLGAALSSYGLAGDPAEPRVPEVQIGVRGGSSGAGGDPAAGFAPGAVQQPAESLLVPQRQTPQVPWPVEPQLVPAAEPHILVVPPAPPIGDSDDDGDDG